MIEAHTNILSGETYTLARSISPWVGCRFTLVLLFLPALTFSRFALYDDARLDLTRDEGVIIAPPDDDIPDIFAI